MSKQERVVSYDDIQVVQNLIERCLQLYMSQSEVMSQLLDCAKIEPSFTELVWQNLEAQNEDFFRAYHLKLMVKDQILRFNHLLERHVELTQKIPRAGPISIPMSNTNPLVDNTAYRAPTHSIPYLNPEDAQQVSGVVPNAFANMSHSVHSTMVVNTAGQNGNAGVPLNMPWLRNSYARVMQGFNGVTPINNILEPRNGIGGATISSFNSTGPNGRALHAPVMAPDSNSLEFFGQMNGNFGLAELTDDYAISTGIIDSYLRSPFPTMDASVLDPHTAEEQQADIRRLGTKPDGFNYKDFNNH